MFVVVGVEVDVVDVVSVDVVGVEVGVNDVGGGVVVVVVGSFC